MDCLELLYRYYVPESLSHGTLITHSRMVVDKALRVAARVPHLKPDLQFIEEAAMLHDIGIYLTDAPGIGCHGEHPYICHGVLGRELLDAEGLPKHALVCERHLGMGITAEEVRLQGMPLPERDMLPVTLEEQIICYADKFFSKHPDRLRTEKSPEAVRQSVGKYGEGSLRRFEEAVRLFGE